MVQITISDAIKEKCPKMRLGVIDCGVTLRTENNALWQSIEEVATGLQTLKTAEISKIPTIAATRNAYKLFGKDPARYRPSSEALLRRVTSGKGLYRINNVVDALNLVSISTGYCIGGYNTMTICGKVVFGVGRANEPYEGIGRGALNIEGLPTFRDEVGAFGTPTSDSVRTSVTNDTTRFLMVLLDFDGLQTLEEAITLSVSLLRDFADGHDFYTAILD